jgi:hypothetical protein
MLYNKIDTIEEPFAFAYVADRVATPTSFNLAFTHYTTILANDVWAYDKNKYKNFTVPLDGIKKILEDNKSSINYEVEHNKIRQFFTCISNNDNSIFDEYGSWFQSMHAGLLALQTICINRLPEDNIKLRNACKSV